MIRFLKKIRGLRFVRRWNFHPHVKEENVAEHSFWVAIYALAIAKQMGRGEQFISDVTMAALLHDAEESITGDLPALVKRYVDWKPVTERAQMELFSADMQDIAAIHKTGHIDDVVKAADLISALVYADEELNTFGNRGFFRIKGELIGSIMSLINAGGEDLFAAVMKIMVGLGYNMQEQHVKPIEMSHL